MMKTYHAPKAGSNAAFALANTAPELRGVLFDLLEALQDKQHGKDVDAEIERLRAAGVIALNKADIWN